MRNVDKILAPIDFSPASLAAAYLAAELAATHGAELTLINVMIPPMPGLVVVEPVAVPAAISTRLEASRVVATRAQLDDLAETLAAGLEREIRVTVKHGATVEEISGAAAEAQLVVAGCEGATLIPHHVATELARNGDTPVLACPVTFRGPLRRALIAIDFSVDPIELATAAAELTRASELIELFHLHSGTANDEMTAVNREAHMLEVVAARTETEAMLRGYVGRGHELGPEILARADEIEADVICIGVEPEGYGAPLIGLAEELVAAAARPVLLIPTELG
jgi:nucleotide-binding universal stress UspA family protein